MNSSMERTLVLVLLVASFAAAHVARAQEATSSPPTQTMPSAYRNTTEGLQQLLQDMRAASQAGDQEKVAVFLKAMEVPNCEVWLRKTYDAEKANSWMSSCDPKVVASSEKFMEERFLEHATANEEILARKVDGTSESGKGLDSILLRGIKSPLDIYLASWKETGEPLDGRVEPIGYFVFVDGGFRLDIRIQLGIKTKRIHGNVVPARLIKKVNPAYPPDADSQRISGAVRVNFTIGVDGAVHNAHAISGEGLSEDPSLRKAAEEAVSQWRYQPASLEGKPLQTNGTVDITFSPRN